MPSKINEIKEFTEKVREDFYDEDVLPNISLEKKACALISCRPAHDFLRELCKKYPVNYRRVAKILKIIEDILNDLNLFRKIKPKVALAIHLVHPYPVSFIINELVECAPFYPLKKLIFSYLKEKQFLDFRFGYVRSHNLRDWYKHDSDKTLWMQEKIPLFQYLTKWYFRMQQNSFNPYEKFFQWKLVFIGRDLMNCFNGKETCRFRYELEDKEQAQEMFFKCVRNTKGIQLCWDFLLWIKRKNAFEQNKKLQNRRGL